MSSERAFTGSGRSSSPGEFHPEALTEPCVNLSIHTALHIRSLLSFESKPSREKWAHPEHPVGRTLRRAMSSPSLPVRYRRFNAVGSEVAHLVSKMLATVRRSNRACSFPAHGFHEDSYFRDAIEGIS